MSTSTDRIEKQIVLKAPLQRVWRALTDSGEFGEWFRVKLTRPFVAGKRITGPILHKGYEHITWDVTIEQMVPEKLFSWRWRPHAIDPDKDYSQEPTTLVVFELSEVPGGTLLKVTESGFDGVPIERRETAYRGNTEGWSIQVANVERYVSQNP
jgi:uncharacterized protein YndB with AHSA1/START domain